MAKSRLRKIVECVHMEPDLDATEDGAFPGLTFDTGRLALKESEDAPRVVWINTGSTHGFQNDVGGRLVPSASPPRRENSVLTRLHIVEAHCWGFDLDDEENQDAHYEVADRLVDAVIAATKRLQGSNVAFGGDTFPTQSAAGADYAVRGEKAIVLMTIQMPVIEEVAVPVVAKFQSHKTTFVSDLDENKTEVVC